MVHLVRGTVLAATLIAAGGGASTSAAIVVDGSASDWNGKPTGISGTSRISNGEFVHTDWLYDAWGANVDGIRGGQADAHYFAVVGLWPNLEDPQSPRWGTTGQTGRFRTSGDFGYPPREGTTRHYDMAADVAELRVTVEGNRAVYLLRTTALREPDQAVFAIAIDTDGDPNSGGGAWPFGANLAGQLGFDRVITVWGTGGAVTSYADAAGGEDVVTTVSFDEVGAEVAANVEENVIELAVPLSALGSPGAWTHRVIGGLWDRENGRWLAVKPYQDVVVPGGVTDRELGVRFWYHFLFSARPGIGEPAYPNVYQVLFRPHEPNTWWRDDRQADDLARGDVTTSAVTIDMTRLGPGGESSPAPRLAGPMNLVHVSALDLGEGLSEETSGLYQSNYRFLSREQPWSMIVPTDYEDDDTPLPWRYFLHYLNGNHNNWIWGVEDCRARRRTHVNDEQGFGNVRALIDAEQFMVGSTLARGGGVGYTGIGRADYEEVWTEAHARFDRIDPERTSLMGMSMGAGGTSRLAPLRPDRFNVAISYSGAGDGPPSTVGNLRNLPYVFVNGDTGLDAALLANILAYRDSLDTRDYEHAYFEFVGRAHDYSLVCDSKALVDPWIARTRRTHPARVTYRIDPADADSRIAPYDHAYWATGIAPADESTVAEVDLTTLARADELPKMAVRWSGTYMHPFPHLVLAQGLVYGTLADFETHHPVLGRENGWTAIEQTVEEVALDAPSSGNRLTGTLDGVAAVTVDTGRAALTASADSPLVVEIDTSTPASLRLDGMTATSVTEDGTPYSGWLNDANAVVLTLRPGAHTYHVE